MIYRGDGGTRTRDILLAKHARREPVTCALARRRGQEDEIRVPESAGESPKNAETVHIGYTRPAPQAITL